MSDISKAKQAHRFRVYFDRFGTGQNLTNQVFRVTRPHVAWFDPEYGVVGTKPIEIDLRDDAQDTTRTEVFTQLADQISNDASFELVIETMNEDSRVLERWSLSQCRIVDCHLSELNSYNASQLVIRLKIDAKHVKVNVGENVVTLR
jgi:hypothetical protein